MKIYNDDTAATAVSSTSEVAGVTEYSLQSILAKYAIQGRNVAHMCLDSRIPRAMGFH